MTVLTIKEIRKAVDMLRAVDTTKQEHPFWVDNEHFYSGKIAKAMGFDCTKDEIERAKQHPKSFIKQAYGIDLYLTTPLKLIENV